MDDIWNGLFRISAVHESRQLNVPEKVISLLAELEIHLWA